MIISEPQTKTELEEYYHLRWRVLRAPWDQPPGSEKDDLEDQSHHLTIRTPAGQLAAVGRVHLNSPTEAQIRYMATEEKLRGAGLGRLLVEELEKVALSKNAKKIVLNARDTVTGFYQKLGYSIVGKGPTMFGKIEHSVMEKVF